MPATSAEVQEIPANGRDLSVPMDKSQDITSQHHSNQHQNQYQNQNQNQNQQNTYQTSVSAPVPVPAPLAVITAAAATGGPSQSYPASPNQLQYQQQHQHLQAGAVSPGVTFSDEQYDSDMDAELHLGPSHETLHEGQVLKAGYLYKKGERIKIWKKKWFVLRTSKLAYYKDSKEYVLLRIIDIRDIHKAAEVVVKNRTGVFVILTPRRTFTVQAESVAEMEEWIEAINQAKVQYELTSSSSDMDLYPASGSMKHPEHSHSTSAPSSSTAGTGAGTGRRHELVKQGSGTCLPRRQHNPMSLSDPGFLLGSSVGEDDIGGDHTGTTRIANSNNSNHPNNNIISNNNNNHNNSNINNNNNEDSTGHQGGMSGLSLVMQNQSTGQTPTAISSATHSGAESNRHLQSNRTADGLSLVTSGTQAIRIGSAPSPRDGYNNYGGGGGGGEFVSNSFSSNHSFNTSPGTPTQNSPAAAGYGSGGEQCCGGEHNVSSEEEDVIDDPTVLEAGRVAAAANAPGSGLVTGEQLESKVVRQGYLLKLGNKYKRWRKKWFVLRGDKLTYYKNAKEYQPLGIIPLSTIIDSLQTDPVSKHKQYCLRIVTSKRSFVCCASDEDTLLQWIDALHVECARVAREAKREKEGTDLDDALLTDPRALGRTAYMDTNAGAVVSPGGSSAALGSSAQSVGSQPLKRALNLDTSTATAMATGSQPITFSTSPVSLPSVTFQTSEPIPARSPPTVTFSV